MTRVRGNRMLDPHILLPATAPTSEEKNIQQFFSKPSYPIRVRLEHHTPSQGSLPFIISTSGACYGCGRAMDSIPSAAFQPRYEVGWVPDDRLPSGPRRVERGPPLLCTAFVVWGRTSFVYSLEGSGLKMKIEIRD